MQRFFFSKKKKKKIVKVVKVTLKADLIKVTCC